MPVFRHTRTVFLASLSSFVLLSGNWAWTDGCWLCSWVIWCCRANLCCHHLGHIIMHLLEKDRVISPHKFTGKISQCFSVALYFYVLLWSVQLIKRNVFKAGNGSYFGVIASYELWRGSFQSMFQYFDEPGQYRLWLIQCWSEYWDSLFSKLDLNTFV